MKQTDLLLAALGADQDRTLAAHVARLQAGGDWAQVAGGYLFGAPRLSDLLAAPTRRVRVVVPLLMCDGVLSQRTLPELRRQAAARDEQLVIAEPIGLNEGLAALMATEARRLALGAGWSCGACGLLLAAHGTQENPASARRTEQLAEQMRGLGEFAEVRTGYLSQTPSVADQARAFARPFIVVGLFAGMGSHAREDVPAALAGARQDFLHVPAIGAVAGLADLIADAAGKALATL